MKFKTLHILIVIFLFGHLSMFAEWDKAAQNEFTKADEYQYIFDMSGTDYCGMDSISFVEYNAARNNLTPENYAIILKYIGAELKTALKECTNRQFVEDSSSNYVIYIHLDEISEKAGMKVTVKTYVDSPDNGQTYKLKVQDGRWNRFDVLLQENAGLLAKKIANYVFLKKNSYKVGSKKKSILRTKKGSDYDPVYN